MILIDEEIPKLLAKHVNIYWAVEKISHQNHVNIILKHFCNKFSNILTDKGTIKLRQTKRHDCMSLELFETIK